MQQLCNGFPIGAEEPGGPARDLSTAKHPGATELGGQHHQTRCTAHVGGDAPPPDGCLDLERVSKEVFLSPTWPWQARGFNC